MSNFKSFNLKTTLIDSLNKQGYFSPSEVQEIVIPKALKKENLLVQSETGSGKTHCYLIPIINNQENNNELNSLIIAPTNELAKQIYIFCKKFKNDFPNIKFTLISSETSESNSINSLKEQPNIVIGTPGRIKSMISKGHLKISNIKTLIIDEADMILDYGYANEIDFIIDSLKEKHIMIFSATLDDNLKSQISKYIGSNFSIIQGKSFTNENVKHYLIDIHHQDLVKATLEFLRIKNPYFIIIFASSKKLANEIYEAIKKNKFTVTLITGDLSDRERKANFKRINNDEYQVVVASDLLSRGLDFNNVSDVLSVDLPSDLTYYFHRSGRTARFNKTGNSYIFYNQDEIDKIIELINKGIMFSYLSLKNNELIDGKPLSKPIKRKKEDEELTSKIKKAKYENSNKKIKPCYKKKIKVAIDKVKRKHKREIIRKDIRKQREERYRKEAKENE